MDFFQITQNSKIITHGFKLQEFVLYDDCNLFDIEMSIVRVVFEMVDEGKLLYNSFHFILNL